MIDPGIVLSKRYEILGEIGAGGMAHVYKAKDYKLRRMVALKVLKHEYYQDEAVLSKFKKEALAAGGLTHPNIVAVYDLGQEYNIDYIVMEYIEGKTLKELIDLARLCPSGRNLQGLKYMIFNSKEDNLKISKIFYTFNSFFLLSKVFFRVNKLK